MAMWWSRRKTLPQQRVGQRKRERKGKREEEEEETTKIWRKKCMKIRGRCFSRNSPFFGCYYYSCTRIEWRTEDAKTTARLQMTPNLSNWKVVELNFGLNNTHSQWFSGTACNWTLKAISSWEHGLLLQLWHCRLSGKYPRILSAYNSMQFATLYAVILDSGSNKSQVKIQLIQIMENTRVLKAEYHNEEDFRYDSKLLWHLDGNLPYLFIWRKKSQNTPFDESVPKFPSVPPF